MLDAVSLNQLRIFIATVEEGSFSAAGRRLSRAQSLISESIGNLEAQLGVALFNTSGRYPRLTEEGSALLSDARAVIARLDGMKARAKDMAAGIEAELSAAADVFVPIEVIAAAATDFPKSFPKTPLRLYVEAMGGPAQLVMDSRASFGIIGSLPTLPPGLIAESLCTLNFVMVASSDHPLARIKGLITKDVLSRHVQLVLTDRTELSAGSDFGVMSPLTWRIADLFAKHALLLAGLGWGGMPRHVIKSDLAARRLIELRIENEPSDGYQIPMSAIYRTSNPPGPASRWMIEHLKLRLGKR